MALDLRAAVEAATILSERRENDGLASFDPFVHQRNFIASTKPEAWLFGANRSGKTDALAYVGSSFMRFGCLNPADAGKKPFKPVRVWFISLIFDMSRNILQPKIFNNGAGLCDRPPFIPDEEIASWNITNQTLILKNGSIGVFKSGDGGRDIFMGADIDFAGFDEVPKEENFDEVVMRVGGGRRLIIRGAATILPPPGVPGGVSWMFSAKVQPWLAGGGNATSPLLDIFTASIYDNKTILPEELERMESRFPPGSPEYLIRMKGHLLPSIGGALVYSPFNRVYHTDQTLAPMHEGRPRPQIQQFLPLVLSTDFNPANGVWLVGQRIGHEFRVNDEITLERSDIASMVYEFRSRFPTHGAELWIYGDATGRRREAQTGESSFHLIQQYMSGYPVPIRFKLPDVNPPVKDRVDAVLLQLRPPDGMRRIAIAPHCTELLKDLERTKWKANGKIDKDSSQQSNGADCLGYWINYEAPTRTYGAAPATIRSIRRPTYGSSGAFPATKSNRPIRVGNTWYQRPAYV